jgi:hypothetical protein
VMGVVEQQSERAAAGTDAADFRHEGRIRPLVHHDDIRIGKRCFMVEFETVDLRAQLWERSRGEIVERCVALVLHEVAAAPGFAGSSATASCPRRIRSRMMPRRKCALPWFQSDISEWV